MKKEHGLARPVILSNGKLHIGINKYGEVHDFYFPYVGLENHAAAKNLRHKVGIYVDGQLSWLDDGSWVFEFSYHKHSLIGHIKATNDTLGIVFESDDFIDAFQDVFIRNMHIVNTRDIKREIKLFMHQVFDIGDKAGNGDTVQYLPDNNAILTYRGNRAFVIGGSHSKGGDFDQRSLGLFGIEGHQGTYADAEDGYLSNNTVEHGRVDSTIGFTMNIDGHSSDRVYYWISVATSVRDAIDMHDSIREKKNALNRLIATHNWWTNWSLPAQKASEKIDEEFRESFVQSVLLLKSHISNNGAVIASTDTTMLKQWRDAYGYCWPRDGAYVLWPLIRLGYRDEALAFFRFYKKVIHPKGYLGHKYEADGSLGASWHGYVHDGIIAPPIQEDETASVLFTFVQFYQANKKDAHYSSQLLKEFYHDFIKKMADFLAGYIHDETGLPNPSYDLWEERFLTTTYTTSVVYGSLLAAADLAENNNDQESAVRWRTSAEDIRTHAHEHLYNKDRQVFYKGMIEKDDVIQYDAVVDSSAVYGVFMYSLYPLDSPELTSSVDVMKKTLSMPQNDVLGLARYENDSYFRISQDIPGNPWFITALWLAQYYLETDKKDEAIAIVRWCKNSMLATGVLSEQYDPYAKEFRSVAPLMWSQAEYVSTLLDLASGE